MAGLIGLDLAYRRSDLVRGLALWNTSYRSDGFARAMAESLVGILRLDGSETGMRAAVGAFLPVLAGRLSISAPPTCASASSRFEVGVSFATTTPLPSRRSQKSRSASITAGASHKGGVRINLGRLHRVDDSDGSLHVGPT